MLLPSRRANQRLKDTMSFRFQRSSVFVIILALLIAYGYFSKPGHYGSAIRSAATPASVSGSLSIQGPYFSDQDGIADRVVAAINRTQRTLDIAVYSIT
jgi:hypothetical protein